MFLVDLVAEFNVSKFLPKKTSNVRARKIAADLLRESRKNVKNQSKKYNKSFQPLYHDVAHSSLNVMSKLDPTLLGKTSSGKLRRASNIGFTGRNEVFVSPLDIPLHRLRSQELKKTYPKVGRRVLPNYDGYKVNLTEKTKQTQEKLAQKMWRDKDYRKARYAIAMDAVDSRRPEDLPYSLSQTLSRTPMKGKGSGTWIHSADVNAAKNKKVTPQPSRYKDTNYRKNYFGDKN